MRKEDITLLLVLILAFSLISFAITPQHVYAITQFNLNTNYAYGLPNPYQAVLLQNYLVIGYLSSPTQLNLFVYNNQTGSNTTTVVNNFPYPLNNFYLFPFNNTKILIVTFYTYLYTSGGNFWIYGPYTYATVTAYLVINTYLYTPSTNTISNTQQVSVTTFSGSNVYAKTGIPNCNYVGSNSYSLSSINPRVFVCSTPIAANSKITFWLIVLNYNFISYASITTVSYTTNIGQEIFYSIVDTYNLLSGSSASGWIDNNSTNIAFTATFSPSSNALSVASASTSTNQPFPFLTKVYSQAGNLYGMLGNINASTGGSPYTFYVENWFNTPQYVPNIGYLYPTVGTINPTYINYYYMVTSSGNPGAVQSFSEGFSTNITFSDVGGTFYYPNAFQVVTTLIYYIGSTSTSDIELDAFNNATTATFLSSRLPTQLSGIFLTGVLQYFGNVLIYWSGSTSKLYVQLVSGYLNSLGGIIHNGGGGGGISNTPPPPSPTSNFTLSFTPSTINMFLATIFIFIPAIILIPFLGIAGFIAGATLGTIFAIIAGFIPYWALVVIVLLIIALILRGRTLGKEE